MLASLQYAVLYAHVCALVETSAAPARRRGRWLAYKPI